MKKVYLKQSGNRIKFLLLMQLTLFLFYNKSMSQCPNPPGDQLTSGSGSWIGYVYADTNGGNPPSNAFATTYRGYVTESEQFDNATGVNPISGANLCGSYANNFAIRYKMTKTFVAGYYAFAIGGNDGYRLSLDGGVTYVISNWSNHGFQTSSYSLYLDGTIDLVLEYYNQNNFTRINFSYSTCTNPSTAPTQIVSLNEVCNGSSITLTADGGTESPNSSYQWGTGNSIGSNIIVGQTGATVTVSPTVTTNYWVRRIDATPCDLTTSAVTKTITVTNGSIVPTAITGNTTVCYADTTTLTAVGYSGSIQWQSSSDNVTFNDIVGENGPSYTFENVINPTYIRVSVKNGSCSEAYSSAVNVLVNAPSVSGTISGAQTVCSSGNSTVLNVSGNVGSVQWQSSPDNVTFTDIVGETNAALTVLNLNATTFYRVKVKSGACQAVFSNSVSIIVNSIPLGGTATVSNSNICAGINLSTLSLTGFSGSIQWQQSNDNVTFTSIPNATTSDYNLINLSTSAYYRAAVSNSTCSAVYSNAVFVTVNPTSVAGSISGATVVCAGANSTVLTASGQVGAVQWQSSTDNINFTDIAAAMNVTYTANNLTATTYYRLKVNNGVCQSAFSAGISVVVNPAPVGGTASGTATVCSALNSTTLTVAGNNGAIQWQSSLDNVTFTDITGATGSTYTAVNIAATTYYKAKVSKEGCPAVYSTVATLTFLAPIPGTISGAGTICLGETAVLTLSGYNGTIQWQSSTDNITFANITGATAPTYLASGYTSSRYFRVRITGGSCGTAFSAAVLVSVTSNTATGGTVRTYLDNPTYTSVGVVSGFNNHVLTVSGNTGSSMQWQSSTDNVTFTNIAGATSTTYTVSNVSTTTYYRVATLLGSCTAYSNVFTVTICTPTSDPTVYGTGTTWRIYLYGQNDGANPPTNAFTAPYRGFTNSNTVETFDFTIGAYLGSNVCGANWTNTNRAFRYRLTKNFPAGNYTFRVGSNGGYRMSIDGGATWLINNWTVSGTAYTASNSTNVSLSGNVNLVIEYFNLSNVGGARHTFNYCDTNLGAPAPTVISGSNSMCLGTNTTLSIPYSYSSPTCQWGTGTTPGSNIIAGATGGAIFISPTTTTTYWVRRYNSICNTYSTAAFKTVTVTTAAPQTPAGNTTDYGNEQWIGYVYASKNAVYPGTAAGYFTSPFQYAGYTTVPDIFVFSGWVGSATPTQFTASTLCGNFEQFFSVRYKMTKNFAPGYYTFTVNGDDGSRLSLDGGNTWVINNLPGIGVGTYSIFLSGSTNLVLEYNQGGGNYYLNFNYTACTNLSTAPTTITGTTTVCNGSSTTLTATGGVNSTGGTYQWGTGAIVGSNILAGTTASITVSPTLNTTYWVRRVNPPTCQETLSGVVSPTYTTGVTTTVNVNGTNAVAGTISGGGNSVCPNSNSTVLTLTGSVGTIQWQSSANNSTWTNISGATASTYTATNLAATTYYRAVVTSGTCSSATTTSVNVIVIPAVAIAGTISGGNSVCGTTNNTVLTLTGYTGTLQWQTSSDNVSFTNINGATSATLSQYNVPVTTYYRVVVTNGVCSTATTASVSIIVNILSVSGTASGNASVCSGSNSSAITLTGSLGGIQWQSSNDNSSFTNVAGATSATYTATNLTATKYYRALVSNGACPTVVSNAVSVFVNPSPVTGTISGATSLCYGTNSATLTLSGSSGAIQWQSSSDNSTFNTIPFETTASLPVYNLTDTTYYRVVLSNGICTSVYPGSAVINVNPISVAGTISGATTVCSGTGANLALSGYTGSIQWQSSSDNSTFTDIVGATNPTYTTNNLTATTYYKAVVTSGLCASASTTSATIYVRPASNSGTAAGASTVCTGINSTDITLSGYVGNIQWQSSNDNVSFTNVFGATSDLYTAINLTGTKFYRAVVTTNLCSSATSNSVEVTVLPNPAAGSIFISGSSLSSVNVCSGTNTTTLSLVGSSGVPQWQSSTDNVTFTDIAGANSNTYVATGLTVKTYFKAVLESTGCGDSRETASVLINIPDPVIYNGVWSGIPSASTNVIVASNLSILNNLSVCSCRVTGTSQLTVPSGLTLQVQRAIEVEPTASLVVEDTGSILQIDDNVVNTGNIVFNRNTSLLKRYDYTYFSSPVMGQTLGQLFSPSLYYSFSPTINNWVLEAGSTVMAPGIGYILRAPNDLDYTTPRTVTATFNGVPNNGIVSVPITKITGTTLNLIGNPYPSAIDIDQFILDPANSNLVNGTIYIWTHNTAIANSIATGTYNYTRDDYCKYNLTGGVCTAIPEISLGVPTGKIAAGQSFFISSNDALSNGNYSATFSNKMRVVGQNNQFYRSNQLMITPPPGIERNRVWVNIAGTEGSYDQMLLGYVTGASNSLDNKFDGRIFPAGNVVSIYSVLGSDKLSIQGRALPFNYLDVIPLGYSSTISGSFSISLENFDGLFLNQNVYLLDKSTNVYHNLKQSSYNFTTETGTFEERFELHFDDALSTVDINLNNVVTIHKSGKHIAVDAGQEPISSVTVFDIYGKQLFNASRIATTTFNSPDISAASQLLIVKVVLEDGSIHNKKVLYY